jgi:hypothetical protein
MKTLIKTSVICGLLSVICYLLPAFAYTQQGFVSYSEANGNINFSCATQCAIQLGTKGSNDMITINNLSWDGIAIVGIMGQNNQLIPVTQQPINSSIKLMVSQFQWQDIPDSSQLTLIFQGSVQANASALSLTQSNFIDSIGGAWKTFWANEGQTFYGINLRYGHKLNSSSVVIVSYRIFILWLIYLYFKKKFNLKNALYLGLGLFLILAIRNQIDYSKVTIDNLKSYTFASEGNKHYGNLWDYYEFITNAREKIWIKDWEQKDCKVFYSCWQDRPFCIHMRTVFMKPCSKTDSMQESDYQLYYKKQAASPIGTKILEFKWSTVYKTK